MLGLGDQIFISTNLFCGLQPITKEIKPRLRYALLYQPITKGGLDSMI